MKILPNYHPPQDYRRPTKTQEKVYVPVNDYPEINFSMIANSLTPQILLCFGYSRGCALDGSSARQDTDLQGLFSELTQSVMV